MLYLTCGMKIFKTVMRYRLRADLVHMLQMSVNGFRKMERGSDCLVVESKEWTDQSSLSVELSLAIAGDRVCFWGAPRGKGELFMFIMLDVGSNIKLCYALL